jgi:hypothetical protein
LGLTIWLGISQDRGYSGGLYNDCVLRKRPWRFSLLSFRTTGLRLGVRAHAIVPHSTGVPACLIFVFAFAILSSWAFSSFYHTRKPVGTAEARDDVL